MNSIAWKPGFRYNQAFEMRGAMVQGLARATGNPHWQAQQWVRIAVHLSMLPVSIVVNFSSDPINPQWVGATVILTNEVIHKQDGCQ